MNVSTFDLEEKLPPRLARWSAQLVSAGLCYRIDPFLVAAVMDRESRGGEALYPPGPTGTGDFGKPGTPSFRDKTKGELGHGRGLMQIDDRFHLPYLRATYDTGVPLWKDPTSNVLYGTWMLWRAMNVLAWEPGAVAAYNCGLGAVQRALAMAGLDATEEEKLAAVDALTTGRDYAADVLARRDLYLDLAN